MLKLNVYQLGIVEYPTAERLQHWLASEIKADRHGPALLLLEHPHIYTFGRQGKQENLLWSAAELQQKGIGLHWTNRGGDVTYHGPGQLVGYPIIPLEKLDTLGYLRKLEETLIQTLALFGIQTVRVEGQTGVWVSGNQDSQPPAKIASIGVRVNANRVTQHGFALDVSSDMSYWKGIIACGLDNQAKTSMAALLEEPPKIQQVISRIVDCFTSIFSFQSFQRSPSDLPNFVGEKNRTSDITME
jgi:lipoate-protein ligase B